MSTNPPSSPSSQNQNQNQSPTWSPSQYLKFANERNRPCTDLITRLKPLLTSPTPRIYDLGCGPGTSTQALLDVFPDAEVTGMDASAEMLVEARRALPGVEFMDGDLSGWEMPDGSKGGDASKRKPDVLFSNAAIHWLRHSSRIPTIVRLFSSLEKGGILAFQVPDNHASPTHSLMRRTALLPGTPWSQYFLPSGILTNSDRPDLDPIEPPQSFYNALQPYAESVDIWRTEYMHVLEDARGIVEWVRGTGLRPFLQRMGGDRVAREGFLSEYEKSLREEYPPLKDGRVMLGYPRLFLVAVRR